VPAGLSGFYLSPSQRQIKKDLCELCVLSEAGGEKVIEVSRSNPTAQMEKVFITIKL